jgi:alpha-tubulin suppressor-like RCC1 family protein
MSTLYGFGSNGSGQLGIGHLEDTKTPAPCLGLPKDDPIVKISGGGNHSAVLTKSGKVLFAGFSQIGEDKQKELLKQAESGDTNIDDWIRYRYFESPHVWTDVACGWASTLLVSSSGQVFGIGTSRWNELGVIQTKSIESLRLLDLHDIVSVACGWRHALALDKHGQVFGWGWGKDNQLGSIENLDKSTKYIQQIQMLSLPQKIVQIECGHKHSLLRGQDGTVYSFGSNKYGQIAKENVEQSNLIGAGWHHSLTLDKKGVLEMWGRNDNGQLESNLMLDQVECGSEHTIGLRNGQVLVWGWNEHGNCASDEDYTTEPTILNSFGKVSVVGAGCATSWFYSR